MNKPLLIAILLLHSLVGLNQTTYKVVTREQIDSSQTGELVEDYNPFAINKSVDALNSREKKFITLIYENTYAYSPARHTYLYFNDTLATEFIDISLSSEEQIPIIEQWAFKTFGEPQRPPSISYVSDSLAGIRFIKKHKSYLIADPSNEISEDKLSTICLITIESSEHTNPEVNIQVDYLIMNEINKRFNK